MTLRRVLVALLVLAAPVPAGACRIALLLALDVSASVDSGEFLLQRNGLASALLADEVQTAFLESPEPVALAAYQWSGRYNQALVLDWRLIRSRADLVAAAEVIAASKRSETEFPTALGYALGYAASVFRTAPDCVRRKIDVSGDGRNNEGFPPALAYRDFQLDGVTVNALAVGGSIDVGDLVDYYRREVIRGPGAFVETAGNYKDFEDAMRRKLEREVGSIAIGALEPMR